MKNYDESIKINYNPNWPYIFLVENIRDGILIVSGSGSGKTNVLLNLVKYQWPDIDKIYLRNKEPFESN